jgi:hypothetical protein
MDPPRASSADVDAGSAREDAVETVNSGIEPRKGVSGVRDGCRIHKPLINGEAVSER